MLFVQKVEELEQEIERKRKKLVEKSDPADIWPLYDSWMDVATKGEIKIYHM